ncbi:MAG: exo-alpha-sialidase [Chloroflexi bacterium]|nr:MAG: exo-alpha-sialidase [Chloroflexota bacterium]TMD70546.1 MAG: exo-alpha-sialidase [Chloroflexota bacterium]
MPRHRLLALAGPLLLGVLTIGSLPAVAAGNSPPGTQSDSAYAMSGLTHGVSNVFATTQTSCYRPEVPYTANAGPNDGYSGESACPSQGANTGEDTGASAPFPTQVGSNPGFAVGPAVLAKNHSESDIRVDPTNPNHLIGSVKWFASAEGYNHLLGFYESWDGGTTWPVQGHIPGYEGWTDNTDPVGAFDGFGNYYELILPYQFFYLSSGSHSYQINQNKEPNPAVPAEVISVSVHPRGSSTAKEWLTTHNGGPDYVAPYPAKGREPDKQWIAIDTNPNSPHYNTIYAMWALFDGLNSKPYVATAHANKNGTHTDWSTPQVLPTVNNTASDTYLLPHVTPDGTVWTSVTNFPSQHGKCCISVSTVKSTDGGLNWTGLPTAISNITVPSFVGGYANTTFTDGIDNTFATGTTRVNGAYPLYIAYNQQTNGISNVFLTASYDGGTTWTPSILVNDNVNPVDEFQPNLAVSANGTVSVNFYDRRLACPAAGTAEASAAGLALDQTNVNFAGMLPPYGATNYCINTSIQFFTPKLAPKGSNIRLSLNTWDPQLNAPLRFCVCSPNATFIGDYFGNTTSGSIDYTTSISTYDDGHNPGHFQQQVVAKLTIPTS